MKRLIILLACLANLQASMAQRPGTWRSYLAYYNTTAVAEANELVYALANASLYSYGKEDLALRYYSKEDGLSDNQISAISFNSQERILLIAYANGNIDLMDENRRIYNLPFLLNSSQIQDKTIYAVFNDKETAYLPAAFGILAVNLKKKEIKETYRFQTPVSAVTIYQNRLYALTDKGGIKSADLTGNMIDPANWHDFTPESSDGGKDTIQQICVFQNTLCVLIKSKGLYYLTGEKPQPLLAHASLRNIKVENNKLLAFSPNELYVYTSFTERDRGNLGDINDVSSLTNSQTLWLASGERGITAIRRTAPNQYETLVANLKNDGPKRNYMAFLRMQGSKLYIAGGGRDTDRKYYPVTLMIYDTDSLKWNNLSDISNTNDATSIAVDPRDDSHYFASTWGEGVFEYTDGQVIAHYDHTNSLLSTIAGMPSPERYVRVEGLCYDKDNNLWMTNSEVPGVVVVLKADGKWARLSYEAISNPTLADKILIARNGHKWINLLRGQKSGIFVFNDKGTIDDTSDDDSHYYSFLSDSNGDIGANEFFCLTEDRNGAIWIGTNRGVFIVSNPSRGVEGSMTGSRIIYTNEYGNADYFLKDERVNAIAVDGGNRKWIATTGSGLYLTGEDGTQVVQHFTTDNSPLLSDNIQSLAINPHSGEVFIGTDKGLISYMGDAIEGSKDYSQVSVYPNPVRPGFDERVLISGLMENSNVKITDLRGNLIYQGRSMGGQLSWNCRTANGSPLASGVYLVLSSTPEAAESVVAKIAVVR